MIAFSTIADGIAYSGKHLLDASGAAATHMVGHRYGDDARQVAAALAGGVKNVGLVYIDVTGVSRRAVIKSVAKGMVVGRVKGGGEIVVGGDGDLIPEENQKKMNAKSGAASDSLAPPGQFGEPSAFGGGGVGFGNQMPPSYSNGAGESVKGQNLTEKY